MPMDGAKGKIEWKISAPIFREPVILKQLEIAIGIPFGLVALLIGLRRAEAFIRSMDWGLSVGCCFLHGFYYGCERPHGCIGIDFQLINALEEDTKLTFGQPIIMSADAFLVILMNRTKINFIRKYKNDKNIGS
jgi:hypothetical protein